GKLATFTFTGCPVIPTFHGPDCVAPTVPETVAVPVVGNGSGPMMVTGAPGPAFAAFWPPLIRTAAAATARTAGTAIRRFLKFIVFFLVSSFGDAVCDSPFWLARRAGLK